MDKLAALADCQRVVCVCYWRRFGGYSHPTHVHPLTRPMPVVTDPCHEMDISNELVFEAYVFILIIMKSGRMRTRRLVQGRTYAGLQGRGKTCDPPLTKLKQISRLCFVLPAQSRCSRIAGNLQLCISDIDINIKHESLNSFYPCHFTDKQLKCSSDNERWFHNVKTNETDNAKRCKLYVLDRLTFQAKG